MNRIIPVLALLVSGALEAQPVPTQSLPPGLPNAESMMAAMQAAQADAARPGDDALSCDQLLQKVHENLNDPAVQAHIQAAGAAAQRDLAPIESGNAPADAQAQQAEATARIQSKLQEAQKLSAIMPRILRGQRLVQLAVAKNCEWTTNAGIGAPPAVAPQAAQTDR